MNYPMLGEVEAADVEALIRWNRFLPSPTVDREVEIIQRVVTRLQAAREVDPGAYVAASKSVGW